MCAPLQTRRAEVALAARAASDHAEGGEEGGFPGHGDEDHEPHPTKRAKTAEVMHSVFWYVLVCYIPST